MQAFGGDYGELNSRLARNTMERSKGPLVLRPILRCNKLRVMSGIKHSARESFQIRFRAAGLGIAAANKKDRQWFVRHHERVTTLLAPRSPE